MSVLSDYRDLFADVGVELGGSSYKWEDCELVALDNTDVYLPYEAAIAVCRLAAFRAIYNRPTTAARIVWMADAIARCDDAALIAICREVCK